MRKIDLVFVVALLAVIMRQSSVAEAPIELAALRDQVEKLRQEWHLQLSVTETWHSSKDLGFATWSMQFHSRRTL